MPLPGDPLALAAMLPDIPQWVETRSLLLSAVASVTLAGDGQAAVATDGSQIGAVVGDPSPAFLKSVLRDVPSGFELIVQREAETSAEQGLPDWTSAGVIVHALSTPYSGLEPQEDGVIVSSPPAPDWLDMLPDDIRVDAVSAEAMAVRVVDRAVAAVCVAGDVTEALWDVGVDTMEVHRRKGFAGACFRALATHMATTGRQPVWCAYEDYPPSLGLALRLGFKPVTRIAVFTKAQHGREPPACANEQA